MGLSLSSASSDDQSERDAEEAELDAVATVLRSTWWVARGESRHGRKSSACEDRCVSVDIRLALPKSRFVVVHCAAAVDGHGGDSCAAWVAETLPSVVESQLSKELRVRGPAAFRRPDDAAEVARLAAIRALAQVEASYRDACTRRCDVYSPTAGACVALAVALCGALAVANLGDSRAWIVDADGLVSQLSETHRTRASPQEADRIRESGGHVSPDGRVAGGALEPTRTLGDFDIKRRFPKIVTATPHSVALTLPRRQSPPFVALVLASDGVCDTLSQNVVGNIVATSLASSSHRRRLKRDKALADSSSVGPPSDRDDRLLQDPALDDDDAAETPQIAKSLVERAKLEGSTDDATAVVLEFRPPRAADSPTSTASQPDLPVHVLSCSGPA